LVLCGIIDAFPYQKLENFKPDRTINEIEKMLARSIMDHSSRNHHVLIEPSDNYSERVSEHPLVDAYKLLNMFVENPNQLLTDTNSIPILKTYQYVPDNVPTFDTEMKQLNAEDLLRLTSENNMNKYLEPQLDTFRQQSLIPDRNVAIQLLATTNIFHGYGSPPIYKFPYAAITPNVWNIVGQNVPDTVIQNVRPLKVPEISKSSPPVIIVALSPEKSIEQETTTAAVTEEEPRFIAEDDILSFMKTLSTYEKLPVVYEPITTNNDLLNEFEAIFTTTESPIEYEPVSTTAEDPIEYEPVSTTAEDPIEYEPVSTTTGSPTEHEPEYTTTEDPIEYEPVSTTTEDPIEYEPVSTTTEDPIESEPVSTTTETINENDTNSITEEDSSTEKTQSFSNIIDNLPLYEHDLSYGNLFSEENFEE
jgi:hypothetical protein